MHFQYARSHTYKERHAMTKAEGAVEVGASCC